MSTDTNMDRILKEWAEARRPADDRLGRLANRIRGEIVACRYAQDAGTVPARLGLLLSRAAYVAMGFILALTLAMVWVRHMPGAGEVASLAAISAQRAATGGELFAEMERLFAQDFRWMAESGGDLGIGVEALPGGAGRQTVPALVRLTLVTRAEGQKTWRLVWKTDVIVQGEDRVEISPNHATDNRVALWVCPLDDGKVAVDSVVCLKAPIQIGGRLGTVVSQGVPVEVMTGRSAGTEYRVFQTTTMLKRGQA